MDGITEKELPRAAERAAEKLKRIIMQEGDCNGERLQPWYLEQLIAEECRSAAAAEITRATAQLIMELKKYGDKWGQRTAARDANTKPPAPNILLAPIVS
jgi:hypothetical protein